MDTVSSRQRSWIMSRVRGKNTSPELAVRRVAHALGFRFRLHRPDLPGTPDLVFPKLKTAVFVNGCFWHRHSGCSRARMPKSRLDYWKPKLTRNAHRDRRVKAELTHLGWRTVVIWECETADLERLASLINSRLLSQTGGRRH